MLESKPAYPTKRGFTRLASVLPGSAKETKYPTNEHLVRIADYGEPYVGWGAMLMFESAVQLGYNFATSITPNATIEAHQS